ASKTGLYQGTLRTLVPSAMRRVCAAANVNVSNGSSTLLYLTGRGPPAYGSRGLIGHSNRSRTQRLSKPKSSALCGRHQPLRSSRTYLWKCKSEAHHSLLDHSGRASLYPGFDQSPKYHLQADLAFHWT